MLKVWIPGTSDTTDQGLNNLQWVNDNVTIVDGKLGESLSFNGSSSRLSVTNFQLTNKWSIALWAKCTSASSGWMGVVTLGDTNDANIQMGVFMNPSGNRMQVSFNGKYNSTLPVQNQTEWNHICATYDGSHMLFYLNGVYVSSTAAGYALLAKQHLTIGAESNNATSGGHTAIRIPFNGQLNDMRIWDNQVLSAEEVRILARGLVLHYPLTKEGFGQDNLLPHTDINQYGLAYFNTYSSGKIIVDTQMKYNENNVYKITPSTSTTSSGASSAYNNNSVTLTSGTTYAYSCMIYSTVADTFTSGSLGHFQTYTSSAAHNRTIIKEGDVIPANKWTHVSIVFTPTADCSFRSYFIYFANTSQVIYVCHIKLEVGNKATPWTPATVDDSYSELGLDKNIVYDVSGYKRNGTKVGTINISSTTPKNIISSIFTSNSHIYTPTLPFSTMLIDAYTISFWSQFKDNTMTFGCSNGNRLNLYATGSKFYWNTGDGSNNPFQDDNGTVISATPYFNSIHFYAITGDGTNALLYIDGEYVGKAKTYKYPTGTIVYLNGWQNNAQYNINSYISDFRIYATALSAEAIKELYDAHTE